MANVKLSARCSEFAAEALCGSTGPTQSGLFRSKAVNNTREHRKVCVRACVCARTQRRGRSRLCNFLRQSKLLQGGIIPYVRGGKKRKRKKELSPVLCSHCNYTHDVQKYTHKEWGRRTHYYFCALYIIRLLCHVARSRTHVIRLSVLIANSYLIICLFQTIFEFLCSNFCTLLLSYYLFIYKSCEKRLGWV